MGAVRALDWRTIPRHERWIWWAQLWRDVVELQVRYELPVRCGWWEHPPQLEALAALCAWTDAYDQGEWDDPPGKLSLLLDLERIGALLRDGGDPFRADRDRLSFDHYLERIGCLAPAAGSRSPTPPQER